MSSIQISNQVQSLDINKNFVAQKKNKITIKVNDAAQEQTQDLSPGLQLDESIDLIEHEKPNTYTLSSSVDGFYESNIKPMETNIEEDNLTNTVQDDMNDTLYESAGIYSFDEPLSPTYDTMNSNDVSTVVLNDDSVNLLDNTVNDYSDDSNQNISDTLNDSFNELYEIQERDNTSNISSENITNNQKTYNNDNIVLLDNNNNDSVINNKKDHVDEKQNSEDFYISNAQLFNIDRYQNNFNVLRHTDELDKNFLSAIENASLTINGNKISNISDLDVLSEFQKYIPNLESRQLLSSYIGANIFKKPFDDLLVEYPDLYKYKKINPVVEYDIQKLNFGHFRLNVSNTADLELTNDKYSQKYKSIGVKECFIISKDNIPELYYSSFVK